MIIECKELTKTYPVEGTLVHAVNAVDLSVDKGDFLVILGHSGSGKTTLLSLIGGLTSPDSGQVFIDGVENWQQSDRALSTMRNSKIGFIFQFASLIPTLSVMENILLPLSFGQNPAGSRALALDILAQVGLADKGKAFPSQLSGGQQRRVAIARVRTSSWPMNPPAIWMKKQKVISLACLEGIMNRAPPLWSLPITAILPPPKRAPGFFPCGRAFFPVRVPELFKIPRLSRPLLWYKRSSPSFCSAPCSLS
jgi:putative ABC transport system ATP-binding protein/lipoprotein-releasing system ATP-binding protein